MKNSDLYSILEKEIKIILKKNHKSDDSENFLATTLAVLSDLLIDLGSRVRMDENMINKIISDGFRNYKKINKSQS